MIRQGANSATSPDERLERAKLLLRIGQACERAQDWAHAEHAYAQSDYPSARYRRMRVYERTPRLADALSLALTAEAARRRAASISARMSTSSAVGAAGEETDTLRLVMPSPRQSAAWRR